MPKFSYKFESVKRVKEVLEKKAQKEVAVIEMEIEKWCKEQKRLQAEEQNFGVNISGRTYSIADLKYQKSYQYLLQKKIEAVIIQIDKLKVRKQQKLNELIQKSKEHKIFSTLEENYLAEFNYEQNKIELSQIDEIATQKFVRKQK